jgi:hypothetical protein
VKVLKILFGISGLILLFLQALSLRSLAISRNAEFQLNMGMTLHKLEQACAHYIVEGFEDEDATEAFESEHLACLGALLTGVGPEALPNFPAIARVAAKYGIVY